MKKLATIFLSMSMLLSIVPIRSEASTAMEGKDKPVLSSAWQTALMASREESLKDYNINITQDELEGYVVDAYKVALSFIDYKFYELKKIYKELEQSNKNNWDTELKGKIEGMSSVDNSEFKNEESNNFTYFYSYFYNSIDDSYNEYYYRNEGIKSNNPLNSKLYDNIVGGKHGFDGLDIDIMHTTNKADKEYQYFKIWTAYDMSKVMGVRVLDIVNNADYSSSSKPMIKMSLYKFANFITEDDANYLHGGEEWQKNYKELININDMVKEKKTNIDKLNYYRDALKKYKIIYSEGKSLVSMPLDEYIDKYVSQLVNARINLEVTKKLENARINKTIDYRVYELKSDEYSKFGIGNDGGFNVEAGKFLDNINERDSSGVNIGVQSRKLSTVDFSTMDNTVYDRTLNNSIEMIVDKGRNEIIRNIDEHLAPNTLVNRLNLLEHLYRFGYGKFNKVSGDSTLIGINIDDTLSPSYYLHHSDKPIIDVSRLGSNELTFPEKSDFYSSLEDNFDTYLTSYGVDLVNIKTDKNGKAISISKPILNLNLKDPSKSDRKELERLNKIFYGSEMSGMSRLELGKYILSNMKNNGKNINPRRYKLVAQEKLPTVVNGKVVEDRTAGSSSRETTTPSGAPEAENNLLRSTSLSRTSESSTSSSSSSSYSMDELLYGNGLGNYKEPLLIKESKDAEFEKQLIGYRAKEYILDVTNYGVFIFKNADDANRFYNSFNSNIINAHILREYPLDLLKTHFYDRGDLVARFRYVDKNGSEKIEEVEHKDDNNTTSSGTSSSTSSSTVSSTTSSNTQSGTRTESGTSSSTPSGNGSKELSTTVASSDNSTSRTTGKAPNTGDSSVAILVLVALVSMAYIAYDRKLFYKIASRCRRK